jgi:hypothetical protein
MYVPEEVSRILLSSLAVKVAEKLYQDGFLSYPRTETDQFDPQFDHQSLIVKQTVDGGWGAFAQSCVDMFLLNAIAQILSDCRTGDTVSLERARKMIKPIPLFIQLHTLET